MNLLCNLEGARKKNAPAGRESIHDGLEITFTARKSPGQAAMLLLSQTNTTTVQDIFIISGVFFSLMTNKAENLHTVIARIGLSSKRHVDNLSLILLAVGRNV